MTGAKRCLKTGPRYTGQRTVLRGKAVDGEITGQKRHVVSLVILGSSGGTNYLGLR